jgi:hypothetical protein
MSFGYSRSGKVVNILNDRIKQSPMPRIEYEIDEINKTLVIKSNHTSQILSSVMGHKANEELILESEEVTKHFVHDVILTMITVSPPPSIQNMTPDALIDDHIIELTTRRCYSIDPLESAVKEKLFKYQPLNMPLLVFAVGFMQVFSNFELTDENKLKLISVFCYCMKIQTEFITTTNQAIVDEMKFYNHNAVSAMPKLVLTKFEEPVIPTFDEFLVDPPNTRMTRKLRGLPFFQCAAQDDEIPPTDGDSYHHRFCFSIRMLKAQHREKDWNLAYCGKSRSDEDADYIKPSITTEEKILLAKRGLRAKRFQRNHEIKQHILQKKLPISVNSPLGHIDEFIDTVNIFEGEALSDFDLVIREVALNMKRKTDSKEFIVRKILNRPIYVIISNTRYSLQADKPSFFSVVFKGTPIWIDLFSDHEKVAPGWYMSEFCSIDRRRLEHLIGIQYQMSALDKMLKEQMTLSKLSSQVSRCTNILFLILVSDNNALSLSLQQLRYYYMELYSGFQKSHIRALKILRKWPLPFRHIMQVWLIHKIKANHQQVSWPQQTIDAEADEEEVASAYEKAKDDLPRVKTPFGFDIINLDLMLLASYLGNLKNKDEQNPGHDSKVILEKILKREYEYRDNRRPPFVDFPLSPFQANQDFIKHGAFLFKQKCLSVADQSFSAEFSRLFSQRKAQSDLSSLFSTKSSSLAEPISLRVVDDLKEYDSRSKVFVELLKTNYNESSIHDLTDRIISECVPNVSLFKKNQIGGVREIYILHITFRIMVKILEDYSRVLCTMHPAEMMTKPESRDMFVPMHNLRCKKVNMKYQQTLRWSGDMTNWANLFINEFFECCLEELLPQSLVDYMRKILAIHKKKKLFLPKELLKSFMTKSNILADDNLMRLRDEFRGAIEPNLMYHNSVYMTCISNMMQGILHYTSSVYHACHLEVLQSIIESHSTLKVKVLMDFEVSSDDEGILISMLSDDEHELRSFASTYPLLFRTVKHSVDLQFGVRTSFEKSTLSCSPIFEFNSIFKAYNNTSVPLIKFVSKSIMDPVSETLHSRVTNLYSLSRQVRENGGSGELVHHIMICQRENYLRNLGKDLVSWFNINTYNDIPELTIFGVYKPPPYQLAGIVGADYQNWHTCKENQIARRAMLALGCWTMVEYRDKEFATSFSMFPMRKYIKALKSLDLTLGMDLTVDGLKVMLKKVLNPHEQYQIMKMKALTPGIANSFSWLSRTDNVMLAPYLLLRPIMNKKTLLSIVENFKQGPEIKLTDVFPQHYEFSRLEAMSLMTKHFTLLPSRPRRTKKLFYPVMSTADHRRNYKPILAKLWFDEPCSLGVTQYQIQKSAMQAELTWLKDSAEETLKSSPFEDYLTMMSFFNNYSKTSNAIQFYTYGGGQKHNFVEDIIVFNSRPMMKATFSPEDERYNKDYHWMCLEDRFYNWTTLLADHMGSLPSSVLQIVKNDLKNMMQHVDEKMLEDATRQSDFVRRQFSITIACLLKGETDLQYVEKSRPGTKFYIKPQIKYKGNYTGPGSLFLKLNSCAVQVDLLDETATRITAPLNANVSDLYARLASIGIVKNSQTTLMRAGLRSKNRLELEFNSGFRLGNRAGGFGERFSGFKTGMVSKTLSLLPGTTGAFLSDILCNTTTQTRLKDLVKADDFLSKKIIEKIKQSRKGTFFIRLSEKIDWTDEKPEEKKPQRVDEEWNPAMALEFMKDLLDIYGAPELEDISNFREDIGVDMFDIRGRRLWSMEVRVDSPCYLRWASLANGLVEAGYGDAFMTEEEEKQLPPTHRSAQHRASATTSKNWRADW